VDRVPRLGLRCPLSNDSENPRVAPSDAAMVEAQLGRAPREPWRVAARCDHGYPTVIVSPSVLADDTLFPTYAWLTCPHLSLLLSVLETAGAAAGWAARAVSDPQLAEKLVATDIAVRVARTIESGGEDACAPVGLAGQKDPLGVKCLHAHVALALVGIEDPIGVEELGKILTTCSNVSCASLIA
jgi:uncharacterized protein